METSLTGIDQLKELTEDLCVFVRAAMLGKIHFAEDGEDGEEQISQLGSGETPVSNGLSEKYSPFDIAHFYIARELDPSWLSKLVAGFKEFCHDVQFEERYAGSDPYCCNNKQRRKT